NSTVHGSDPATKLHWNYGDPVSLTLRWAKNSPFLPANIPSATRNLSPQVNGDTVSWTFKDGWSFIRFIQAFTASDSSNLTSAQPFVLTFNIPEGTDSSSRK